MPAPGETAEARETSGITSRLILSYVEREGGRKAVDRLLARCDVADQEERLRDENHWFSFERKIALLEAASEILHDPHVARHVGEHAMDFNVGQGVKLSLRALGSPRLVYRNIVRASGKFTLTHRMEAISIDRDHARIRYVDVTGTGYHPFDCQLNVGLLSAVPNIFGQPLARLSHPVCARDGGDTCIYDLRWQGGGTKLRAWLLSLLGAVGVLGGAQLLDPALLPEAAAVVGLGGVEVGRRARRDRRRAWRLLEAKAEAQADVAERLANSLQELVSDLRLGDVLAKVTRNAQSAVGGKEFALLIEDKGVTRCESSSGLPQETVAALERWAKGSERLMDEAILIDDLGDVPGLEALPCHPTMPLGSLCAAPLVYHGRALGVLVALANATRTFLPNDVELLQSYAAQAAIALTNARLYEAQQALASRDPLTGLLNHREFHETIARELERCRRHGGEFSTVLFDLDGFKLINDTDGHAEGDHVLRHTAAALIAACRTSDFAFRIGGDEFALVLPETDARAAAFVASRAAEELTASEPRGAFSYGIAGWPDDGPSKDTLLREADKRLYEMKRNGDATARPHSVARQGEVVVLPARRRERERLAAASRLGARLMSLQDPAEIARVTARDLQEAFGAFLVAILWVDGDGVLVPVAGCGPLVEEMEDAFSWRQHVQSGVMGRVARTGEPALISDTARDPDFIHPDVDTQAGSELAVPIRVGGDIWGVLNIEDVARGAFDTDDLLFADMVATQVGSALHRSSLLEGLEGTFMNTLAMLSDALETKDSYTADHARQVADLTERVGARLGLVGQQLRTLRYGALLHDIGKIGVPSEILNKPGPLTDEEFEQVKQHTVIGERMLRHIPFFESVHPLVRSAHERWDGGGYPDGLEGDDIPMGARIICACDAFHAMTSDRPYRAGTSHEEALRELRRHAGTQFDAAVVDALCDEIQAGGFGEQFVEARSA
jgi:diguanylate cyclase (GGDEF)-like protein